MSRLVLSAPHFNDEGAAYAFVEERIWGTRRSCPHCGTADRSGPLQGKSNRIGLYKCYACRKPFTVKIGTIFEGSHIAMRDWLVAIHLIASSKKGMSANQLHRTLGITLKSAWFMAHRIREAMKRSDDLFSPPMGGDGSTIEADVTYVGRKPGTKVRHGAGHLNPVFSLVERDGSARSFHVPNVTGETLRRVVAVHASRDSHFMTDEARTLTEIGWNFRSHGTVKHSEDEYVRGHIHTNTVEGYFSILKRGVYGVYQHVSEAHLHRYLAEFDFRYSNRARLGVDDAMRAARIITGAKAKRLTYRTTNRERRAEA
ncbi:MAG TPA: IS1595 family transposase [Stellaceae bacterium]|nr:IS1595 family transposase [Stellaceae bacterium]